MKKFIWIGPIVDPSKISFYPGLSPAANNWSTSFIEALRLKGYDVFVLSYIPEPSFPFGKLLPFPKISSKKSIFAISYIKYLNLPYVRHFFIGLNLVIKLLKINGNFIVITYNNEISHFIAAHFLKSFFKFKWVNITADSYFSKFSDLNIFLSFGYFKDCCLKHKIHIDGGVSDFSLCKPKFNEKKLIIFSGAINQWTGIIDFSHLFVKLNLNNYVLHIFGKGDISLLSNEVLNSKSVVIKGFVEREIFDVECKNAYCFVNPRPTQIKHGEKNFPSKLFEYLRFGRPIISTKTYGLAPCYNDILFFFEPSNPKSLIKVLETIENLDISQNSTFFHRTAKFAKEHNWDMQINKFLSKIDTI